MDKIVLFTRHSPRTYALVSVLVSRGHTPTALVFEGRLHETMLIRVLRLIESFFLFAERMIFFRRHQNPHECYRRFGSLESLMKTHNIRWHTTENHNHSDSEAFLKDLQPDYLLLCGTRLIKPHILSIPKKGTLNAHSAMLPHYRGAKSEYWILSKGDTQFAGVTIHWVDATLDTGDLCLQEQLPVSTCETTKTLRAKSITLSAHLFSEVLRRLAHGETLRTPQVGGSQYERPTAEVVRAFDEAVIAKL